MAYNIIYIQVRKDKNMNVYQLYRISSVLFSCLDIEIVFALNFIEQAKILLWQSFFFINVILYKI